MSEMGSAGKPRLLVLASTYPRWAGDHEPGFVHELARRLTEHFEVSALVPHAPGALTFELLDGVQVHRFRYAPSTFETLINDGGIATNLRRAPWKWLLVPCFMIAQLLAAARLLGRQLPDVVHAHWIIPQGLIMASLSAMGLRVPPVLLTSHGADLFTLKQPPLLWLKRFACRRAEALTVVSRAMLAEVEVLGVAPDRVQVRSMGVDLSERFTPCSSVARSDTEILFVGRLVEKKGVIHLVRAMPKILEVRPRARLSIAGFGPDESRLKSAVQDLGLSSHVVFLGAVAQHALPSLYRRAAVFVAPFVQAESGDQEGLGLVVPEAVGCGCPVVVSDIPAARDFGLDTVQPGSSEALAARIISILSSPEQARASAEEIRRQFVERFDWGRVAAEYSEVLDGIVLTASEPGRRQ